ncbi:flippase-like domain-containing protein, partial [bacterium]|nr:flippase-like domain-containing protein [bacterium]
VTTMIFRSNFAIFAQTVNLGKLLPEIIINSFVTISNPLGATGATAYMVKRLVDQGNNYMRSIFSIFAAQLSISIAFSPVLGTTLWYLNLTNHLNDYQIIASQVLLIINLVIIGVISFILLLPQFSIKAATFAGTFSNILFKPVLRKSLINTTKLSGYIHEVQKASGNFSHSLSKFLGSLPLSLLYHLLNILILAIAFKAYGDSPAIEIVIAIYGTIVLFSSVSPTPQGVGIVEGLAQITAVSIGVPSEHAVVAILSYRIMTLWLPALLGLFVFRSFKKLKPTPAT